MQKNGTLSQTDRPDFRRFSYHFGTDAMNKNNSQINFIVALVRSLDSAFLSSLLAICWRIQAALRGFSSRELNPQSFQLLELRLERLARELARVLLQYALSDVGATARPVGGILASRCRKSLM